MVDKYKDYLEKAMSYYYDELTFVKYYRRVPKSRYHSYVFLLDYIKKNNLKNIVELGTIRSFVDGRFEGCNMDDTKYWEPNNPKKWDWSAGLFTRIMAEFTNCNINTIDTNNNHLARCKLINKKYKHVKYIQNTSEKYLRELNKQKDIFYLDTGDMTPIEDMALLQLLEAHIIVDRNLIVKNGLIVLNNVRNPITKINGEDNDYGRAKYTIPYLLENGFEIVFDEFVVILKKI
jgi:hypothetical protein